MVKKVKRNPNKKSEYEKIKFLRKLTIRIVFYTF